MVITDFNLQSLRTRSFRGFVQFQNPDDPSEFFRMKEKQTIRLIFKFDREGHYSDQGLKVLDPTGHAHSFDMNLKVTSDLIDDQYESTPPFGTGTDPDTGAEKQTLSYWILKNEIYEPIQIIFVVTLEARSGPAGDTSEKFLHFKFTLDPTTFGPISLPSGGTSDIAVSGEVISIEEIIRTNSSDAP